MYWVLASLLAGATEGEDSGKGFDIVDVMKRNNIAENDGIKLSGRGVELVNQLCDTLEYLEQGTSVTGSYIWHD